MAKAITVLQALDSQTCPSQHGPPHPFLSAPPTHQYPTHITPNYGAAPPSQYAQNAPQPPPYGQQPRDAPHADVASLQQRPRYAPVSEEQQYKIYVLPTPASPGCEESQNVYMQHIDTTADTNRLQAAMRGQGCINTALIQVLADPKDQDPRALHQLKTNYEEQTSKILTKEIERKTNGDFEDALTALFMGPLDNDVYALEETLIGERTDEDTEALNDILLCRSNADIRAIVNKYKSTIDKDFGLFHLCSPILSETRAEDAVPAIYAEMEHEAAEIYYLIESPPGTDTTPILRAMSSIYEKRYGRKLDKDIPRNGKSDVAGLWDGLGQSKWYYSISIYRALRLYWSGIGRLLELHAVSKQMTTLLKDKLPAGSYRDLMIALIREKSTHTYMHR
ncbi:hypothetical protein V8C34DRAFT_317666 [Trichoderma compactum]